MLRAHPLASSLWRSRPSSQDLDLSVLEAESESVTVRQKEPVERRGSGGSVRVIMIIQ